MRMIPCAVIVGLLLGSGTVWAQQTLTLTVGGFVPLGEDARVSGDVLIENRRDLFFAVSDFTGPTIGGEYLAAVGEFLEVGAGIGFYRRSVDTVYERLVDSDGTEIDRPSACGWCLWPSPSAWWRSDTARRFNRTWVVASASSRGDTAK